jgi:hypothetical protein
MMLVVLLWPLHTFIGFFLLHLIGNVFELKLLARIVYYTWFLWWPWWLAPHTPQWMITDMAAANFCLVLRGGHGLKASEMRFGFMHTACCILGLTNRKRASHQTKLHRSNTPAWIVTRPATICLRMLLIDLYLTAFELGYIRDVISPPVPLFSGWIAYYIHGLIMCQSIALLFDSVVTVWNFLVKILPLSDHISSIDKESLFEHPFLATDPEDFWTRRWHSIFRPVFVSTIYKPVLESTRETFGYPASKLLATLAVFLASGVLHEYLLFILSKTLTGENLLFFGIHGLAAISFAALTMTYPFLKEPTPPALRALKRFATNLLFLSTAHFLFDPYLRNGFMDMMVVPRIIPGLLKSEWIS